MEYTGYATSWDELVFRGDPESREFVAFWLQGGRVAAAMNVNVWGVTDALGTLIRVREPVDVARLRNPEVPLDELASRPVLRYPGRSSAIGRPARELVSQGVAFARRFVGDRLRDVDSTPLDDLPRGEGRVVEAEGEKLAVFRDNEGTLHALSPVCTHLGCLVEWNRADQSWDCPCHGSRFDLQGRVIQGPARKELEPRQLPAGSFSPQADKEVP